MGEDFAGCVGLMMALSAWALMGAVQKLSTWRLVFCLILLVAIGVLCFDLDILFEFDSDLEDGKMNLLLSQTSLLLPLLLSTLTLTLASPHPPPPPPYAKTCIIAPCENATADAAPAILEAFEKCGHNAPSQRGKVIFQNSTYLIKSVMNTTGLANVDVDLHGTLLWDTEIEYWLEHSLPVGYQNQSSAWLFGGGGELIELLSMCCVLVCREMINDGGWRFNRAVRLAGGFVFDQDF